MYTIGQVSEMFDLPASTLRYYDKEGLFSNMKRESGIRRFDDREIETLRVIECLKKSGLEIKDIKQFMQWCTEGSATYAKRKELFIQQKKEVEAQMERLRQVMDMLEYKCWYYDVAIADGNEKRLASMKPEDVPENVRKTFCKVKGYEWE